MRRTVPSYVLYYYQDILGVSAIAMGVILMAARVFDAFNDPIMGVLVAKTRTRFGKFRPWLLLGTLLNSVVLYLLFTAPPALDGNGLVVYAAVIYVLWGVTYTMMDIPYWSMIPAFTQGGRERENLSTLARSCAGVGEERGAVMRRDFYFQEKRDSGKLPDSYPSFSYTFYKGCDNLFFFRF